MRKALILLLITSLAGCDADTRRRSGERNHTIQKGETLYSIAQREYGDPLRWPLLQEANPWLAPESLQPGDIIYVPPATGAGSNLFNVDPRKASFEGEGRNGQAEPRKKRRKSERKEARPQGERMTASDPGKEEGEMNDLSAIFQNLVPEMEGRTLFGQPVDRIGFFALGGVMAHAFLQGFLLWIVATITFVKDATLKKSMKAAFQTEIVTFFTVAILGAVALLMIHIGTTAPGTQNEGDLLTTIETYVKHPVTLVIAGFGTTSLYLVLCTRFVPQAFAIEGLQTSVLILSAIVLPHVFGLYTVAQGLGVI